MEKDTVRHEIADIEWRRITTIAWPTLSAISIFQALTAENPVRTWQLLYVVGLLATLLISYLLRKFSKFIYVETPVIAYLLLAPILIGDRPANPWMSLGLITFAAMLNFSTIANIKAALVLITFISIFQTYIATLGLKSFTDNQDIALLHSYFSFTWIFVMGVSSFFIYRRYLKVAASLQNIVDTELTNSASRLAGLKQVNQKDSRNLRLHGTILNTLIHMRNLIVAKSSVSSLVPQLHAEVLALAEQIQPNDEQGFREKLKEVISRRTLRRIEVSFTDVPAEITSREIEESTLEIIREYLLNAEKHTNASTLTIKVSYIANIGIRILFIDNGVSGKSREERKSSVYGILSSKTFDSMLKSCGAKTEISSKNNYSFRKLTVDIPFVDPEIELQKSLSQSRIAGLNDFALNFVRASSLVTLISLPGYIVAGLPLPTVGLLAFLTFSLFYILQIRKNIIVLTFLILSSLLIIPSLSQHVAECRDVATIPWIFNHILTVTFLASIELKNRLLKWLPLLILTIESLYFPLFYPSNCKSIFLGSLPAIPLLIVLTLAVLGVRKREVSVDLNESNEIGAIMAKTNFADSYREESFAILIDDCAKFSFSLLNLAENDFSAEKFNLQIQKIQTFLVAAEHFDSLLIRKVFELCREEQASGVMGKISILGEKFASAESNIDIDEVIGELSNLKHVSSFNLTISNNSGIEFHISDIQSGMRMNFSKKFIGSIPLSFEV